jgi:hypothetical protein
MDKTISLCPYKYALGIPGEGIHKTRIFGLAFYDILLTILLSVITTLISGYSFWKVLLFWFALCFWYPHSVS